MAPIAGTGGITRRQLLGMIGMASGSAAMYQAMTSLGLAAASPIATLPTLDPAPPGASVLVLGAGIAGMVAAFELRKAGYRVQVLEFADRPGGRCMTLRGGDRYTELGGAQQDCDFDPGLYFNPGPWRLPYHHHGILAYCRLLGVALETFVQVNYNAFLHGADAFGGAPQRYRTVRADYHGHVAELLAKASQGGQLDAPLADDDLAILLDSLRWWGALDDDYRYSRNGFSSERRGFDRDAGGGAGGRPVPSTPVRLPDLLRSRLWQTLPLGDLYEMQGTMLQPVGGMDAIARAFARELDGLIRYRARVVEIAQDERGVQVGFEDLDHDGTRQVATAQWCVCTLPLSILGQMPLQVGPAMTAAIAAVPYAASVKIGLQFKRRFWEEDEHIYGGASYTDLPIETIAYPSHGYHSPGKAVLLGAYAWGANAMRLSSMSPGQRLEQAVAHGSAIHPQYPAEYVSGMSMAWHRAPAAMGCFGLWTADARERHYDNLCAFDGRIVLAGEHASWLPAWQEGAVTSALDAIGRLHQRAQAQALPA
jgi:monoamine oxidase